MKSYTVTCTVEVDVEAENEQDAINKAHLELTFGTDVSKVYYCGCVCHDEESEVPECKD